jgi:hypothetical protein
VAFLLKGVIKACPSFNIFLFFLIESTLIVPISI